MTDWQLRPITGPEELDLFCRFPYQLNPELSGDLAAGRRTPQWLWVAVRGDRLLARAGWWAQARDAQPMVLDFFDFTEPAAGEALLRHAIATMFPGSTQLPQYLRFLPGDWQDQPQVSQEMQERVAVLENLGAKPLVERLRLEWTPTTPIAAPSERLVFKQADDREELVRLLTLVLEGTLDAHSRRDLATRSPAEVALEQMDGEFPGYHGPPQWWRVACLPGGEPVGFVIPSRNSYNAIIAYIGVVPAHRGHGYIDDILAEGTRILAAQDVARVRAATDVGNVPMARAFARAGYAVIGRQLDMVWG